MKKTKMILSLALALILVFSLGSSIFAADYPENTFADVQRSDWFAEAVDCMQATEIMKGVGDNRFDPYGQVTRAMVVTVLYRLAADDSGRLPDVSGKTNPFQDVSNADSNWYRDPVIWAVSAGVTKGTAPDAFSPEAPITREQMASMIVRFMLSVSEDSAGILDEIASADPDGNVVFEMLKKEFSDAGSISDYARLNVAICKLGGIMKGDPEGTFRPQATLIRAECAQIFLNFLSAGESD